jgi:hypothetical protein
MQGTKNEKTIPFGVVQKKSSRVLALPLLIEDNTVGSYETTEISSEPRQCRQSLFEVVHSHLVAIQTVPHKRLRVKLIEYVAFSDEFFPKPFLSGQMAYCCEYTQLEEKMEFLAPVVERNYTLIHAVG